MIRRQRFIIATTWAVNEFNSLCRSSIPISENDRILLVRVLSGVDVLVLEQLDDLVEASGNKGANDGTNPVDPVLGLELARNDAGSQAACRVETAARVVDTAQLRNEEGQTDTDGGDKGGSVLLGRQHEDGKDELKGQDGFDEAALGEIDAGSQGRADVERGREHTSS
jgi:hypothetical protein